ncbi:hypothetical protein [Arthrobacter livingstonensis]|uniref:hypothetical protein n=1 Tax=Arthrobacter livingstonensis TaxID=670078 RepID=UPI0011B3DE9E|nr:hypothetical protein [Arthrobacter livingstonensis]
MSQEEVENNGAAQGSGQAGPGPGGSHPAAAASRGGDPTTVPLPPAWQAPPDTRQTRDGSPLAGGPYGSAEYDPESAYGAQGRAGSARAGLPRSSRSPFKRLWWTIPKVVVAGVIAVLLAGAGGGAIGYGVGEASAPHRGAGTGQFGGGRYHGNYGPGTGNGSGTGSGTDNDSGTGTGTGDGANP